MQLKDKFSMLLLDLNINKKKVAEITGNDYKSIVISTTKCDDEFPRWAKFAIWVWEKMRK